MKFTFDPNTSVKGSTITAAEKEDNDIQAIADSKLDDVSDDFDFLVAGIEKLFRDNRYEEAITILDEVTSSLAEAIGNISDNFADNSIDTEE